MSLKSIKVYSVDYNKTGMFTNVTGFSSLQLSAERGGENLQCKVEYPLLYAGVIV